MPDSLTPAAAFAKAVEIAGGQAPAARVAGVTQGAIWQRLKASKPAAAEWVLPLEAATGVSKHDLRPDIYPLTAAAQPPFAASTDMEAAR